MRPGEKRFRATLRRLRPPRRRWRWPKPPALTPGQWFRLALLVLGIIATLLGIEEAFLQGLLEMLVK